MGCDGGTIPTRDELVRTKKNPERKDKSSVREYQWQYCHLTQQKLTQPIVSCQLGHLYNKEAIVKMLLKRKNITGSNDTEEDEPILDTSVVDHIRSLKDIRELKLENNPVYDPKKAKAPSGDGAYNDTFQSAFICPIAGLEMNGSYTFIFDWTTGYVISERGHNVVKKDLTYAIHDENIVVLNPDEKSIQEEQNILKKNTRKMLSKKLKRTLGQETNSDTLEKSKMSNKKAKSAIS